MATAQIDGVSFTHSLSGPALKEARASIEAARKTTLVATRRLVASILIAEPEIQLKLQAGLTVNPDVLLTCAITANQKLKASKRQTLEACLDVPVALSFGEPLAEVVPVYPTKKKAGGVRMIHDHGLYHRTSQNLVQRCLSPFFEPRPFQYTHRGVQAAIAEIKALLVDGYVYAGQFDINEFYSSFDPVQLPTELPLPKELADHAVLARHMKVRMQENHGWGFNTSYPLPSILSLLCAARLGIPQGSACSPIVSDYCMSRIPWSPSSGIALVNYADDFFLLATSIPLLAAGGDMLIDAVSEIPGGTFKLKQLSEGSVHDGLAFLGHTFAFKSGALKTSPAEANQQYFWKEVAKLDTQLGEIAYPIHAPVDKNCMVQKLAELVAFVGGWSAAFGECDDLHRVVGGVWASIAASMDAIGVTMQEVKAHIGPGMGYCPTRLYQ